MKKESLGKLPLTGLIEGKIDRGSDVPYQFVRMDGVHVSEGFENAANGQQEQEDFLEP